jgi:DNA repair photolyase
MIDAGIAQALEPHAPSPEIRLRTLAKLSAAGLRTGISLGPVIPGLTDSDIPSLLARAKEAGASFAFFILLRLPGSVAPVFSRVMEQRLPERAGKVMHHVRETRGGSLYKSGFGSRMSGEGPMAEMVSHLFHLHARRLGLEVGERMGGLVPWGGKARPRVEPQPRPSVLSQQKNSDAATSDQQSLFDEGEE